MLEMNIPEFTILSDHCAADGLADNREVDFFDFTNRLGPMLDVLRHAHTEMPVSMAICGGVGTGKTTALSWLIKQLECWNGIAEKDRGGHPCVVPVHFSVRKCREPDAVSKMIMSEILLQYLLYRDEREPESRKQRAQHVQQLVGCCAASLGPDFIQGLECTARRWGVLETLRATNIGGVAGANHEIARLEGCHDVLNDWIEDHDGAIRIVAFIDDLDHVAPDIMMAVFEAVGLPLRSRHVGFVTALDPNIAKTLVKQNFARHEFGDMQCRHYLSKVFHVECDIEPNYQQVKTYYDAQYRLLDSKSGQQFSRYIEPAYQPYFDAAVLHLSSGNPRKIKVLLNSALMKGYAGLRTGNPGQDSEQADSLHFMQNIQIFFLQRWLSYFSIGGSAINREDVMDWFADLSAQARESKLDFAGFLEEYENADHDCGIPTGLGLHIIHEWVWNLLKIPFSKAMATQCGNDIGVILEQEMRDEVPVFLNKTIRQLSNAFKDCLAASLEKAEDELSDGDALQITDLDLSGHQFTEDDRAFLGGMENLQRLDLHNSSIDNIDALSGLNHLQSLNLTCTPLEDIAPLASLSGLEHLDLSFTSIQDLDPLKECINLKSLVLFGSAVTDIEPLRGLNRLARLNLSRTEITDNQLEVLESLPALEALFIRETRIPSEQISKLSNAFDFNVKIES